MTLDPGDARTRIKICGITTEDAALAAADAGADAIGLVFAVGSPRLVSPERARRIAAALPTGVAAVGVFRLDPSAPPRLDGWEGPWVQLHGDETEATAAALAGRRRIIRGIGFDPAAVRRWDRCRDVELLLVDGPAAGSGAPFDHASLAAMAGDLEHPVVLAGGLEPATVGAAIAAVRPFAVDVSSGVESSPGVKEPGLIREFCAAVREADAAPS